MKRSMFVLVSLLALAALLSACAPQGTPTPSVADLQATAMANAQTQIALTAASIPTATPLPPTPMPTPIPVLITAIPATEAPIEVAPTAAKSSSDDPCNVLLSTMKGPRAQVVIKNTTKGALSLYFSIYKTAFGCGTGNVTLAPLQSATTSVPKGCYDFYGWISGAQESTPKGYGCLNFNQTVSVRKDGVIFNDQQ